MILMKQMLLSELVLVSDENMEVIEEKINLAILENEGFEDEEIEDEELEEEVKE